MSPLIVVFIGLVIVTFPVFIFASKPGKHQTVVHARLRQIGLWNKQEDRQEAEELLKPDQKGNVAFIEYVLSRLRIDEPLQRLIEQSDSKSTPAKVVVTSLVTGGAGIISASLFCQLLLVRPGAFLVGLLVPAMLLRFKRTRRLKAFNDALPDAIDLMARALRAGHSVASAIEVVAEESRQPVAGEFAVVYQQQNFGLPFRQALMNMAQRNQSRDLQFLITAMLVQKETGGNLAEILDRTTFVIRERLRIQGEIRIKSAQGRLTGWILTLLPIVMGFLINIVNSGFETPLFEDPAGHIMLYGGAGMLVLGSFFIRRVVAIEV